MEKSLYQRAKDGVRGIALAGLVGLSGCAPQVKEARDMNGDGVNDLLVIGSVNEVYLFLSQKDGKYLRLEKVGSYQFKDRKTDEIYFIDGVTGTIKKAREIPH